VEFLSTSTSSSKSTGEIRANGMYEKEGRMWMKEKQRRKKSKMQRKHNRSAETKETTSRNLYNGNEAMSK
jgi:hypothetical protein